MENEFLDINNREFGYKRFDFLYLEDSKSLDENLIILNEKIEKFFKEEK